MKRYYIWWKRIPDRNTPKLTEKMVGPHNEVFPSKSCNRGRNVGEMTRGRPRMF